MGAVYTLYDPQFFCILELCSPEKCWLLVLFVHFVLLFGRTIYPLYLTTSVLMFLLMGVLSTWDFGIRLVRSISLLEWSELLSFVFLAI